MSLHVVLPAPPPEEPPHLFRTFLVVLAVAGALVGFIFCVGGP